MSKSAPFVGTWRIVEMEMWDRDAFELLGPAHFTFERNGLGGFRFIAVEGGTDCRFGERDGKPLVEFTWLGRDELDDASGRGWAVLEGDAITGRIFFHGGDDSAFTAKRAGDGARKSTARNRSRRT